MTDIIHKFPMHGSPMLAPPGKVLLVDYNADLPTLWIQHNSESTRLVGYFIIPTGGEVEPTWEHVGSAICGRYVWHVYRSVT